ncbi:MAG: glycoside hydrolase N-terminal domain-containing protein [Oscillospiraceae bacterium]|nr:glycoside hydrolase N-terminal domain-containing protein [Oscillospiraceae bacterium]
MSDSNNMKMRHAKPPCEWLEGLPIGNGRLAAMIWGGGDKDIIDLNHEWLWRGTNKNRQIVPAADRLESVRSLLKKGDFYNATIEANKYFGGDGGISKKKGRVDPYQTAGFLEFKLKDCAGFDWRELDIENGICKVSRKISGTAIISEFFASCENGLVMSKWHSGDEKSEFSCSVFLSRAKDEGAKYKISVKNDKLEFCCAFDGGIEYALVSEIQTDGKCVAAENRIDIEGASYVKCMTNIATSVCGIENEIKKYPMDFGVFDNEKIKHSEKFSKIMNGVALEIGESEALCKLPIEERLDRIRKGKADNGMVALYFNFGRYLMVSSSINGDLPANLQGKWNDRIDPPWDSDYHFDINLQMNYWMAEPCNMPQCAEALLKYLETFYESGSKAAKGLYGCRGIYLPIQTDAWGVSTPESNGWAVWIGAAAWFSQHFWNHYIYSGDIDYLKNRGYRYLKAVAEFYEDYLVEDENGVLQVMPSQSPENSFGEARGEINMPVAICISSAMDVQFAYDALGYAIKAAEILNADEDRVKLWKNMQNRLPDFKIGSDGRLLEWEDEKTEVEPGHRHLSHLYGVYPSDLFTSQTRAGQYRAGQKSLEFRLSHGGGHTGWSRAWVSCLQARFNNPEGFYEHFIALIRDFATVSLLDLHPPRIFQIDGNLGAVAALVEAIISYTDGKTHLLRSLPKEWGDGHLQGIKVPGGHIVSLWWKNGKAVALKVQIGFGGKLTVFHGGEDKIFSGTPGDIIEWDFES